MVNNGNSDRFFLGGVGEGAPKSLQMVTAAMKLRHLLFGSEPPRKSLWKKGYDKPKQHIKKQRHYLANKVLSSQSYVFASSHVRMCELVHRES